MKPIFLSLLTLTLLVSGIATAQTPRQLLSDARRGDVAAMRNLGKRLIQGTGIKRDPQNGVKWLKKAADMGDSSAMLMLGDLHHNGVAVSKNEKQALHYYQMAANAGNESAAKRLEKYKVASKDTAPQKVEKTPEEKSASIKSLAEATQLKSDNIKGDTTEEKTETQPNNTNNPKEAAFLAAAERGDMKEVQRLIKEGVNINAKGKGGNTALYTAIQEKHEKLALYLIEAGADIHSHILLMCGTIAVLPTVVEKLLKSGTKISNKDGILAIPMEVTLCRPNNANNPDLAKCVKLLLDAGSNPNERALKDTKTILMQAAEVGATEIVKHLIAAGADIHAKDSPLTDRTTKGYTALLYAAINGHVETAKVLREAQGLK